MWHHVVMRLSWQALRLWPPRRYALAIVAAIGVAVLIGIPTIIIPNPIFGRDIPVVAWNYPVWLATSGLTGMLIATYFTGVKAGGPPASTGNSARSDRSSKLGFAGGFLTWFAVGCPVCNKIALLALGYSGALAWFAPLQPILAITALGMVTVALMARLRGEVACPLPARNLAADEAVSARVRDH